MELKDKALNEFNYIKDCIDKIELPLYLKNLIEQCKNNIEITIKEWEEL